MIGNKGREMEYRLVRCKTDISQRHYRKHSPGRKRALKLVGIGILGFGLGCVTMRAMALERNESRTAAEYRQPVVLEENYLAAGQIERELTGEAAQENTFTQDSLLEDGKILIVIDPGHGGEDEGCSRAGVLEKDVNLQLSRRLQLELIDRGYEVLMTREDDNSVTLEERAEMANDANADICVSIHQNAYEGEEAAGAETWYDTSNEAKDSGRLAKLIHKNLLSNTDALDRGVRETEELYVIRETDMPACLVETGFLSNTPERALLMDEAYQEQLVKGIAEGIDLYFYPKTMYLTFDDGPSVENTNAVLDILKANNIKATFFLVGENVERNPEVAQRIVEEGHTIGIHCYSHDYDTIYASVDSYLEDFQKAYDVITEVTGVEPKLFRFPGGSINNHNQAVYEGIVEKMTEKGFIYFDWNASLEDATKNNAPELLLKNAAESTLGRKKVVMLAHDVIYNTTVCLQDLIDQFPEYRMEPLTEEVTPIQF